MPRPFRRTVRFSALRPDSRGTTVVEFALIAPVFCTLIMGLFDFGHTLYLQGVLQGTVQKAARDSTLESAGATSAQDAIDLKLKNQVQILAKYSTVTITRRYYRSFTQAAAAQPETFTDTNGNGICDGPNGGTPGESYIDANNNNVWDKDGGDSGQGGARDIVVYKVTMTYPRMFPIDKFIGGSGTTTLSTSTVLANQPFGDQGTYAAATTRQCT